MISKTPIPALVLLVFFTGCISVKQPPPKIDYYTLEYAPPVVAKAHVLPYVLKLEPFATSPVYDSNKILYKDKAFKRSEYAYHKWRAVPGDLTAAFLARDFVAASLFKAVIFSEIVPRYSHVLTGKVEEFYQESAIDHWEAVLTVNVTLASVLADDAPNAILFQKRFTIREGYRLKTPEGFVEAMSHAMKRLSREVIDEVYQVLR